MQAFSPREIVSELDRFIIGQDDAKKAVAIALRNRWRRQQLEGEIKEEILPKNILMVGPTGVGKTEISRRLSKLAQAPPFYMDLCSFLHWPVLHFGLAFGRCHFGSPMGFYTDLLRIHAGMNAGMAPPFERTG